MKLLVYDDYNSKIVGDAEKSVVGTITLQFGNLALRHGYKIIEIYDENRPSERTVNNYQQFPLVDDEP